MGSADHRRHQHQPTPVAVSDKIPSTSHRRILLLLFPPRGTQHTEGVQRIDRWNHHARRAGIVRSTAETGGQRARSQKRKPKSDMIFSQCPPLSSSYGRTSSFHPKKNPPAPIALASKHQRHRPLPPTGRTILPTLHHHVTRPRAHGSSSSSSSRQRTT